MNPRGLHFESAYWDDPDCKRAFRGLALDAFGLDLGVWDDAGYWDDDYRPFTFFDADGRAVASVCLYTMRLVVEGRRVTAGQLSAVATRPEYRRRGLARELVARAIRWAQDEGHGFFFLFANDDALPFYREIGFQPVEETLTAINLTTPLGAGLGGARKLNPSEVEDRAFIHARAVRRSPVSNRLGVLNERLLMFHALLPQRDDLWFVEPLDVVVMMERRGGVLTIHDIIGEQVPPLAKLLPHVATPVDTDVVLRFLPDRLGEVSMLGRVVSRRFVGNNLHVRGALPLPDPVVFPSTAQA